MQQTGVIVGVIALVVGGAIGFSVGSGQKETVEVEKIVEVEKSVVSTLSQVKEKGFVQCGVSQGLPGFSNADDAGDWTGLDVDLCRAVAAAVFGDSNAVKFTPLSAKQRFTALACLLYTSPSPRDLSTSRMPSSA